VFINPSEELETDGAIHKAFWECLRAFRKEVFLKHHEYRGASTTHGLGAREL